MNRAERRKKQKQGITSTDLRELYDRTKFASVQVTQEYYTVALSLVLNEKLGFGQKRIIRTLEQVEEVFKDINNGYLDFEECRQKVIEQCGINLIR